MRWKPLGRTCIRKRRMNSFTGSVSGLDRCAAGRLRHGRDNPFQRPPTLWSPRRRDGCLRSRRDGCSGRDRRAPLRVRRMAAWRRRPIRSVAPERERGGEGAPVSKGYEIAEEGQPPGLMQRREAFEKQPPEQARQRPDGQEEAVSLQAIHSVNRPTTGRRRAQSCARAGGESEPSPRCAARR